MKKLDPTFIKQKIISLNGWEVIDDAIEKTFKFDDFRDAMSAMMRISFEAEALDHHPEWFNVYNNLKIRLSTHDADGITEKDFELAKRIEKLISKN